MEILEESEFYEYISAHLGLLFFVGEKRNLLPEQMDFHAFFDAPLQLKVQCRRAFLNHRELLETYLTTKKEELEPEEVSILLGFKSAITGYFVIYKCSKHYAILFNSDFQKFYAVKALRDPFRQFFDRFPVLVKTTILPFKDKIIYDGIMNPTKVVLGPGIKSSLKENYRRAKKNHEIVMTL